MTPVESSIVLAVTPATNFDKIGDDSKMPRQ
jgi:hypothetical protein